MFHRYFSLRALLVVAIFALPMHSVAAYENQLFVDRFYSPYTGASMLQSAWRGYQIMDDSIGGTTIGQTNATVTTFRTVKALAEFTLASISMITQHEIFGHGYRAREFKMRDIDYSVKLFEGHVAYSQSDFSNLHPQQRAALDAAGMEATGILASHIQDKWMSTMTIDSREAMLYLVNATDQVSYAFGTSSTDFRADNDFIDYITQVNAWQGFNTLKRGTLRQKIAWDLFDPMLYMSAYSIFRYIWLGDNTMPLPHLQIGKTKMLPSARTYLSPWGPEFGLKLRFLTANDGFMSIGFRYGRTGDINSSAIDLSIKPWLQFSDNLQFELLGSAWRQPDLLKTPSAVYYHGKFGFGAMAVANYKINSYYSVLAGLGYKLSGFMPGMPLEQGLIWRCGFGFNF